LHSAFGAGLEAGTGALSAPGAVKRAFAWPFLKDAGEYLVKKSGGAGVDCAGKLEDANQKPDFTVLQVKEILNKLFGEAGNLSGVEEVAEKGRNSSRTPE
jgi:hypothetical protein